MKKDLRVVPMPPAGLSEKSLAVWRRLAQDEFDADELYALEQSLRLQDLGDRHEAAKQHADAAKARTLAHRWFRSIKFPRDPSRPVQRAGRGSDTAWSATRGAKGPRPSAESKWGTAL